MDAPGKNPFFSIEATNDRYTRATFVRPFHVELENPHVIEKHQVWVGSIGKGPDGALLNSSYGNRSKACYQSSLGNAVVNFARVVPNGLLLFFPSYTVMNICIENWKSTGIWSRIEQYKPVFTEPRYKAEFNTAMLNFYEKINDPTLNGAIFAAVCRGKVSEGLDFSDNNGRAVVITGLPFPPRMDPKVNLKMQFLDELRQQGGQGLTGQEWYRQQATRAVNQAIGRVIRHKQDFGAIVLCDNRFGSEQSQKELPIWVRPTVKSYAAFGLALRDLMIFFKMAEKLLPSPGPFKEHGASMSAGVRSETYFMPTITRTSAAGMNVSRAATVMVHAPSLRRTPIHEDLSLAKMKIAYESSSLTKGSTPSGPRTLLDALKSNDKRNSSGGDSLTDTQAPSYQAELRASQAQTKAKKKIVIKKTGNGSGVKRDALQSAENYLFEVKQALSSESYNYFSTTLANYRNTEDFAKMVHCLAEIFTTNAHTNHLFRRFYPFVRSHHKEQFDRHCRELLGQGCGFQAKDAIPKKRSAEGSISSTNSKIAKVDIAQKSSMDNKSTTKTKMLQPDSIGLCALSGSHTLNAVSNLQQSASSSRPLHPAFSSFTSTPKPPSTCTSTLTLRNPPPQPFTLAQLQIEQSTHEFTSTSTATNDVGPAQGERVDTHRKVNQSTLASPVSTQTVTPPGTVPMVGPPGGTESRHTATIEKENTGVRSGAENAVYVHGERDLGVECCRCHQMAKIPFQAPCGHVCCVICWKLEISATKSCPKCGAKVKRKNLSQLAFGCRLPPSQ